MKKIFVLILAISLFTRAIFLSDYPVGFHADEVRVAWNSYSILKTGLDDRGNFLALYYNTFGDYRPTGIFYTTIPFLYLFGPSIVSTRLSSAIFGAITPILLYFIVQAISKDKKISLLSSVFLTFSIWHISVSRATSEGVIAVFFTLLGTYLFIKKKSFALTFFSFLAALLCYHSARVIAPLYLITLAHYYKKNYLITFLITVISVFLIFTSGGLQRFSQVSILKDSDSQVLGISSTQASMRKITLGYLSYFSGNFFLSSDTKPIRYSTSGFGLLLISEFILFAIGIIALIKKKKYLFLILFAISAVPAALTSEDSPNLHRSLFMVIWVSVIGSYGLLFLWGKKNILYKLSAVILILYFIIEIIQFFNSYTKLSGSMLSQPRNFAATKLANLIEDKKGQFDQVIVTYDPDEIYPWYALFNKKDPALFNKSAITRSQGSWTWENIIFSNSNCPSGDVFKQFAKSDKSIIVIDGFKCAVESKIKDGMPAKVLEQIKNLDGSVAYTAWVKK